jgi:hypothetical protein
MSVEMTSEPPEFPDWGPALFVVYPAGYFDDEEASTPKSLDGPALATRLQVYLTYLDTQIEYFEDFLKDDWGDPDYDGCQSHLSTLEETVDDLREMLNG